MGLFIVVFLNCTVATKKKHDINRCNTLVDIGWYRVFFLIIYHCAHNKTYLRWNTIGINISFPSAKPGGDQVSCLLKEIGVNNVSSSAYFTVTRDRLPATRNQTSYVGLPIQMIQINIPDSIPRENHSDPTRNKSRF